MAKTLESGIDVCKTKLVSIREILAESKVVKSFVIGTRHALFKFATAAFFTMEVSGCVGDINHSADANYDVNNQDTSEVTAGDTSDLLDIPQENEDAKTRSPKDAEEEDGEQIEDESEAADESEPKDESSPKDDESADIPEVQDPDAATDAEDGKDDIDVIDPPTDTLRIHAIDIGQGDANLIVSPTGESMLIDIGKASAVNEILDILGPGDTLEYVVCTHFDKDHINGVKALAAEGLIDSSTIFLAPSDDPGDSTLSVFETWQETAELGISLNAWDMDTIDLGGGVSISVVAANGQFSADEDQIDSTSNGRSIALLIQLNEFSHWTAGDLTEMMEIALIETGLVPEVDTAKAAHHGASGCNTEEFLKALKAQILIVSVGSSPTCGDGFNQYGHPTQETINNAVKALVNKFIQTEWGGQQFKANAPANLSPPPLKLCEADDDESERDYSGLLEGADAANDNVEIETDGKSYIACGKDCVTKNAANM